MRALVLALALIPLPLWAADLPLESDVTAATLYPQGATVTRQVPFAMPAGRHRQVLGDLPRTTPHKSVRVSVAGATMGSVTARSDFVPPRPEEKRRDRGGRGRIRAARRGAARRRGGDRRNSARGPVRAGQRRLSRPAG